MEVEKILVAPTTKKKFVLSFDGGGVRVVIQWKILQRLIKKIPNLLEKVDVYAGTSAGSILASALATDNVNNIDTMLSEKNLRDIFSRTFCHKVKSLGGLTKARYENRVLRQLLEKQYGSLKLHELKHSLFMPAFAVNGNDWIPDDEHVDPKQKEWQETNDKTVCEKGDLETPVTNEHLIGKNAPDWFHMRCSRWHTVFFHNLTKPCNKEKDHTKSTHDLVVESVLRSCAAPYYFPMVGNCIDGGMAHNNPSLAVASHLLTLGTPLSDIYILSLGSGETPRSLEVSDNSSLGLLDYLSSFINMTFDANAEVLSQTSFAILGERFCRLSPVIDPEIGLDDVNSFERLIYIAETVDLSHVVQWITENIM